MSGWSARRRLASILRLAYRVVGLGKQRSVGKLGGGAVSVLLGAMGSIDEARCSLALGEGHGSGLPAEPICATCGNRLATFASVERRAAWVARGWMVRVATIGAFGLTISSTFTVDAVTSLAAAGTCVQIDAIGNGTATGTGATAPATCGPVIHRDRGGQRRNGC